MTSVIFSILGLMVLVLLAPAAFAGRARGENWKMPLLALFVYALGLAAALHFAPALFGPATGSKDGIGVIFVIVAIYTIVFAVAARIVFRR